MWYQRLPVILAGLALLVASVVAGYSLMRERGYEAGYYVGYGVGYRDGQVQQEERLAPEELAIQVIRAEGNTLQMDIGPYTIYITPGGLQKVHPEVERLILHQGTFIEVTRR